MNSSSFGAKSWQLAKDLQIVILCLVQPSRAVEHRTALLNRRPILSDLRFSGRLEQDADTVLFVHRPCLYQATYTLPPKVPNPHWDQYTEVIAAKVRDELSGEVLPLCFDLQLRLLLRLAARVGAAAVRGAGRADWLRPGKRGAGGCHGPAVEGRISARPRQMLLPLWIATCRYRASK